MERLFVASPNGDILVLDIPTTPEQLAAFQAELAAQADINSYVDTPCLDDYLWRDF